MIKITNLTPHVLNVRNMNGEMIAIQPSGQVARVATTKIILTPIDGIGVASSTFGKVEGLPPSEEGVVYIASRLVLEAVKNERADVFCPGDLIRNEAGQPIGCDGLSR
jgi:hypothetical protein